MTASRTCGGCGAEIPARRRLCDTCRDQRAADRQTRRRRPADPEPPAPQTLTAAMATGDRKVSLEALRRHLAESLEHPDVVCAGCGGRVPVALPTAAVAKELRMVVDELAKITPPEVSKVDEVRRKREERLRAAPVRARAKRGGQRRRGS